MAKPERNPHQTIIPFDLSEFEIPSTHIGASVREPGLASLSDFVPVYTLALRRSDVVTLPIRAAIRSPTDAAELIWEQLKDADREHFLVLLLDTKNRVSGINTVSVGILDSALVHPREVFKAAILGNAAAIIVAHNHPSGDPTPSEEDRRVTERLRNAGQILGIEVMDHIVVGERGHFCSLKERGMM